MRFSVSHPDGMTVRGEWYPAAGGGKRPAVIISHGFNGRCIYHADQGAFFAGAGLHCFVFDFCGGSVETGSDGVLSEMMTPKTELRDLKLIMEHAREQAGVDASRLFLMGESQGGYISTLAAEDLPGQVRGLILWFPALMIPEASRARMAQGIREVFGIRLSPDFDRTAARMEPWDRMKDYPGRVLLVHGDSDPIVPADVSRRALGLFPNASMTLIPGAGHGFAGADREKALGYTLAMIRECL